LEENIHVLLCKLGQIFPPSFFDSMEHLPTHLPYGAKVGGPVQYGWMYPFERYKSTKNFYTIVFYLFNILNDACLHSFLGSYTP